MYSTKTLHGFCKVYRISCKIAFKYSVAKALGHVVERCNTLRSHNEISIQSVGCRSSLVVDSLGCSKHRRRIECGV